MHENKSSWEDFLNPTILRPRLVTASLYIAAFELLKTAIIDGIRSFYSSGFDQKAMRISPEYQSDVLVKNASPLYASLEWLKESQAINEDDIAAFEKVKDLRNELAHKLSEKLFKGLPLELASRFVEMVSLLDKIERWWIVNVEIPTSPELHNEEIDEQSVIPGRVMGLRLMMEIALGSEGESNKYLDEFAKLNRKT
jgi:hypothetical protein